MEVSSSLTKPIRSTTVSNDISNYIYILFLKLSTRVIQRYSSLLKYLRLCTYIGLDTEI